MAMDNARFVQVNGLAATEATYDLVDRIRMAGRYLRCRTYRAFDRSAQTLADKAARNAAIDASYAFEAAQVARRCAKAAIEPALCTGAQLTLTAQNCWRLPAGRYTLHGGASSTDWAGRPMWELADRGGALAIYGPDLERELRQGNAALVDPAQLVRERQLVTLRAASPLRPVEGRTAPVDGLALFDHARQPALAL